MLIYGEKVYLSERGFVSGTVEILNGKIASFKQGKMKNTDVNAYYVLPGFIDIHTHGAVGGDAHHANENELFAIKKYMAGNGTTSFVPTTMTDAMDKINKAIACIAKVHDMKREGANIIGIHAEGPYFTEKHRGAHPQKYLKKPALHELDEMINAGRGLLKIVCVAPEYENAEEFIKYAVSKGLTVSVAHTNTSYERAKKAFSWGASNVTHLYNGMSPFMHREPGCVGAAFDSDVTAEMICDGIHIHPAAVMTAIKQKGTENIVLISDSISAAGLDDGNYTLGSQEIKVLNGIATIPEGNLAGSTTNILQCFKNVISWGVSIEDAVKMASENPARVIKNFTKGKIAEGYDADLTLLDERFEIDKVLIGGIFS